MSVGVIVTILVLEKYGIICCIRLLDMYCGIYCIIWYILKNNIFGT